MALASSLMLGAYITSSRVALAAPCGVPGDCTPVAPVCHLGVCTPCVANYDDGGLGDPIAACQDPAAPICEIPDGSIGGTCVGANGGDAGAKDASTDGGAGSGDGGGRDGSTGGNDGGANGDAASGGDGSTSGDGSAGGDGSTSGDDGGGEADGASLDGAGLGDGALGGDGASGGDGAAHGGGDATTGDGGAIVDDGSYVEGGGCACDAAGERRAMGGGLFAMIAVGLLAARRRSR